MYEELIKQYEILPLEDKKILLIYKSRLFDFINRIDLILSQKEIKEEYKNKYESFKKIIELPENSFIKYSIFNIIDFSSYETFLKSLKIIEQKISNINTIKITSETKLYRAVTIPKIDDISKISTSNLISTSLDIETTDSFYKYDGYDILYIINVLKETPCLVIPYSIKIYEKNGKQILKIEKNDSQKEIILFKELLNYEIKSSHYLEQEKLTVTKIETSVKKNILK